ncbi:alpha/beta hydrolase [Megasphaera hominis]|jgi:acetyl esterase/lipase|uniref:Alpha/beta hydrolase n=1 Tax=Megasphaera hominis TaxID=159836 RepID=A0ABR6VEN6_9FIRM|nr:alpha/beta hydrolase [Megasphaera hominis]MBC3535690.1 alpha/beta hydrolase [Megasphaera hominis]
MNKKWITSLILSGCLLAGGSAFAMEPIHVDSATANMPDKVQSQRLKVNVVTPEIKEISNVVYEQVPARGFENVAMKMDILKPQSKTPLPAIVYVTGGGFINANKDNGLQLRMHLAEAGYVVASIEYRVAPTATFPQPLEDVKASIRYLRANAKKFNIDPDRIGIIGGSAGGYLSAMAGTTSGTTTFDTGDNLDQPSSVKAAVDLYGLSDLTRIGDDYSPEVQKSHESAGATEALWVNGSPVFGGRDGGINADAAAAKAANPITYIGKNSAPMLLMHGTSDYIVSPSQTDLLFQALQKADIPSDRYLVEGAAHGGIYWNQAEVLNVITNFFNKYLK